MSLRGHDDQNQDPQLEEERTLRENKRDRTRQKVIGDNNQNSVLENPNRGGSAGKAESRGLDLGLALDRARHEEPDVLDSKEKKMPRAERERLHEIYKDAVRSLTDPQVRLDTDPLFVNSLDTPKEKLYRVPFESQVPLGVLVDAGRHYFPIDWWKHLIVYLYQLRFTLIQFRLTDDQAFNIRLESYPKLASPVLLKYNKKDKRIYTAQEVRELVQYARHYDIRLIPEINIPGHAGGWANVPNLVLVCPEFTCFNGYGLGRR
jgi:Glycosyl hydrolase family 20, catalytic domain